MKVDPTPISNWSPEIEQTGPSVSLRCFCLMNR